MQRHHDRMKSRGGFNLVALMDIFTVLVFFLLVNSSDVEVLPTTKDLKLPESIATKKPEETLVVMVNDQHILVRGKKVASVHGAMTSSSLVIEALKAELDHHLRRSGSRDTGARKSAREITIMGDKDISFELLKKIMVTCTRARYTRISLAVLRKTHQAS